MSIVLDLTKSNELSLKEENDLSDSVAGLELSKTIHTLNSFSDQKSFYETKVNKISPILVDGQSDYYHEKYSIKALSKKFTDYLFQSYKNDDVDYKIELILKENNKIEVKFEDHIESLDTILYNIEWENLDEKWGRFDKDSKEKYLSKSLLFETLRNPIPPDNLSPFDKANPFINLYTSQGFYSLMNSLLRNGHLQQAQLPYASKETNDKFRENDPNTTLKLTKEILFISLLTSAHLGALPEKYTYKGKSIRIAHLPTDILKTVKINNVIWDNAFLSSSGPGGGFAGGGPCNEKSTRVKYIIFSKKGKSVQEFSRLPENEVLFRPFTKFTVTDLSGDEQSGFRITLADT